MKVRATAFLSHRLGAVEVTEEVVDDEATRLMSNSKFKFEGEELVIQSSKTH